MNHLKNQKSDPGQFLAGDIASPAEVATALHTTEAALAQMRYKGSGPKFVKVGRRVLYRWSDVTQWIASSVRVRTDEAPTALPG